MSVTEKNGAPHNVSVTEKNIKYNQACPRHRDNYYCSHALSVAIIKNAIYSNGAPRNVSVTEKNGAPHNVSVTEKNIKYDQACPRHRDNYHCSHALSVAIIENAIYQYAQSLSYCKAEFNCNSLKKCWAKRWKERTS